MTSTRVFFARASYKVDAKTSVNFDVFNLFNSKNFHRPEVTNLIFNFDGTVQSGNGDPRQVQLSAKLVF